MKITIDCSTKKIKSVEQSPIYFGNNNVDKIVLSFINTSSITLDWYPSLSAVGPDKNPIYPRLYDTDGITSANGTTDYDFTLSNANGWNLIAGKHLFYVWINYPDTNGNECVGSFACTILASSGYYQIDNPIVNPVLRNYLDDAFDNMRGDFNDEYTEEVNAQRSLINNFVGGQPRYVNTSSNILALTSNQGVAVATDTGHWYYWDGSQYVDSGIPYQATEIADDSVTTFKTDFIDNDSYNLVNFSSLEGKEHTWNSIIEFTYDFEENTQYTVSLKGTFISSESSNPIVYMVFVYSDNTTSAMMNICSRTSNDTYQTRTSSSGKTLTKIKFQQNATVKTVFREIQCVKGTIDKPYMSYYSGKLNPGVYLGYDVTEKDTSFFQYGKYNLYQPTEQLSGKWFNTSGAIADNSLFFYDKCYFDIEASTEYRSNCIVCIYDENCNYLSRYNDTTFTTPSNAKYFRVSALLERKDIIEVSKGNSLNGKNKKAYTIPLAAIDEDETLIKRRIVNITTSDDFVAKMKEAYKIGNCDVYIATGVYDISDTNVYTLDPYGITIGNGCHYYFSSNSKVICNYAGSDTTIMNRFSVFFATFTSGDFELYNLTLECSRVRYAIHDECGSDTSTIEYRHIYDNCNIKIDNTNHPNNANFYHCIGGGLGYNGEIIINNCIFNSVYTLNGDISYHGNSESSSSIGNLSVCKLTITGCYFEHTISLSVSGTSTKQKAIISNNSLASAIYYNGNSQDKWETYAWNNNIRN